MRTKALTPSELVKALIERGYKVGDNPIADNPYTLRFGKTTLEYCDPVSNMFDTKFVHWTMRGDWYSVEVYENDKGRSSVRLNRWNGPTGFTIITYNKLMAAEQKQFAEMCMNATLVEYKPPYRTWEERDNMVAASDNGAI